MEKLLNRQLSDTMRQWRKLSDRAKRYNEVVELPDHDMMDRFFLNYKTSTSATWLFFPDGSVTYKTPHYETINCKIDGFDKNGRLQITGELRD